MKPSPSACLIGVSSLETLTGAVCSSAMPWDPIEWSSADHFQLFHRLSKEKKLVQILPSFHEICIHFSSLPPKTTYRETIFHQTQVENRPHQQRENVGQHNLFFKKLSFKAVKSVNEQVFGQYIIFHLGPPQSRRAVDIGIPGGFLRWLYVFCR